MEIALNIKQVVICGESGDVIGSMVDSWKERLPELVKGFQLEDIWNLDESGCFYQALPDRGFSQKIKECKGGKKSKQHMTVALIVNAAGGKGNSHSNMEIRKSKMFQRASLKAVVYFHQKRHR